MSVYYLDTSAALKLLAEESHSRAFATFYDDHANASWVSSALLQIEVIRAVTRVMPAVLPDARDLLSAFDYVAIDDEIVDAAMSEPDRGLRSLDAIHLATARALDPDLTGVVTYGDRLARAAQDAGMTVFAPQD
ncbi:type II toxin-antitoxin system VapC family toxin [Natronosporangium hydrolyticum]|uniref:Ribonuclease VapC n=1 Tax=Natronosporangium hydrolyticum TaxID=2811111 RepID=A0A895YLI5_9ACTN|nr:type II toxin-antitoxin system VapC family toxin [Natronosporangium hydrolyticum]QSB16173.1 type II toxin-antitoxin system VapC family toxin [Natronosporangium hydrolyticum]